MRDPRHSLSLDTGAVHAALAASVRQIFGEDAGLGRWDEQVLAERRGRRVVRYDLEVCAGETEGSRGVQWIGKFYLDRPGDAPHVAGILAALGAAGFGTTAKVAIPHVIAQHLALGLLLLTYLPGERILGVIAAEPERVLGRLGCALAELHGLSLPAAERKTSATIIASLRRRAELLCAWFPAEVERIQQVLACIERAAPEDVSRPALLHNDFGVAQLLWHNGRLGILDFDKCALGDPATDLGNFLAQLRRRDALKERLSPPIETIRALLLDAYRRCCRDSSALKGLAARVAWYEQVVLLGKVHFLAHHERDENRSQALRVLDLLTRLQSAG